MNSLIYFGDSLKALDDNGRVGGYLIRFSDTGAGAPRRDLAGEYFTSSTYLGSRDGDGVDTIFHHAQRLPIKSDVSAAVKQEIAALRDKVFGVLAVPRYR